ncbi:hypothetical protein GZL_00532 [Streptomyces sp. 769]|nr:hypothetical protein GZL_00532 [Streptomyces sp. 769]
MSGWPDGRGTGIVGVCVSRLLLGIEQEKERRRVIRAVFYTAQRL